MNKFYKFDLHDQQNRIILNTIYIMSSGLGSVHSALGLGWPLTRCTAVEQLVQGRPQVITAGLGVQHSLEGAHNPGSLLLVVNRTWCGSPPPESDRLQEVTIFLLPVLCSISRSIH